MSENLSRERVLVFNSERLSRHTFKNSIITDPDTVADILSECLWRENCHFMDRADAEKDPTFKQVIPYCVLTNEGRFFAYQRTKRGNEARLHSLWSLGIGGHINPCDGDDKQLFDGEFYGHYAAALRRELKEETGLTLPDNLSKFAPTVAVISDDTNEVGKVHAGFVHVVPSPAQISLSDAALTNGRWVSVAHLASNIGDFEPWSQIVIRSGVLAS